MPFTLAHPAAVLPLWRARLVFSALIVGSLAPDLPYFLLMNERARLGHTPEGVVRFCLPVGLALLWVFHAFVKRPLVSLAPEFVRCRISHHDLEFRFGPLRRFLLIVASLVIGSFTHVLWDGFTHEHGYFVKHWAMLKGHLAWWIHTPNYKLLQFGCSVLGVAVIAWAAIRIWRRKPLASDSVPSELSPRLRLLIQFVIAMIALAIGSVFGALRYRHHGWKWALVEMVITVIMAFCVEVLLYSAVWHLRRVSRDKTKPLDSTVERLRVSPGR